MTLKKGNILGSNFSGNIKKDGLRKIEISELPDRLPNFRNSSMTKDNVLADWLKNWIDNRLDQGRLEVNDLLPSKKEIAEKTKVSIGTVQTAIRLIEDEGYVASKQRIGTFICDREGDVALRKQTSKREQAIESIKNLIVKENYKVGEAIPSSSELSKIIGSAPNTTRLAVEYLAKTNIIEPKALKGNKISWVLKALPEVSSEAVGSIDSETLVDKVERDLKDLIIENYTVGDKLMSHYEISDKLLVSIKTVHDAMKRLVEQGILQVRRGRYGTYIKRIPSEQQASIGKEHEIFAPAFEAQEYNYERVEKYLKEHIVENHKPGDKLPPMSELAESLKVSSNTIRKALQNMEKNGMVEFSRGRYGGTFLRKMPAVSKKEERGPLSWVALNPEYTAVYSNN